MSNDRPQGDDNRAASGAKRPGDYSGRPRGTAASDFLGPVAGFGVTFSTLFRKTVTTSYPDKPATVAPRFHGRHQLNRWADGLEKCIGCELCAWACPADAIYVEGAQNTPDAQFSPGERYGRVYQINYLRCIFCGLCIEACPTRALTMTGEFELAESSRTATIYEKHQLLGPMEPGMLPSPHPMVEGTTEKNYYRNEITGSTAEQRDWVARRDATGTTGQADATYDPTLMDPATEQPAGHGVAP